MPVLALPLIAILVGLLLVITLAVSAYMINKKLATMDELKALGDKLANPQQVVGQLIDTPGLTRYVQEKMASPVLDQTVLPDRKVSFNEVAKDAVNNPWSMWGLAIVLFTGAVLVKQFRGAGRDAADGVSAVYNEGKTGLESAAGDPSRTPSTSRGKRR
ncbi:hypothetical protein [Deinococcus cellulosilyticus]|uniref:Uncharacterized protein n=1 Tax=Deinococcus cellulosilyticus (strain DSM 18568 / NBRC 106333 / KACC 11606 / 5516J-15) TaxID=1223518 RepID=A0A511MYU6_DEIC1|nr:hypothetical protein [Deinococcus cellulosilyticus]GEM45317.1 hypothetical protein DC3_09520 [Deinococcus cellulosilyticus NBRC 106333 = KACC 11606]